MRIDGNGKEWTQSTDRDGNTVINVALNLSVSGNFTKEQIAAYKDAITTQFNKMINTASNGAIQGTVTFYEGNKDIVQTLYLGPMADNKIGGLTNEFYSSVNLYNKMGTQRSYSEIASDAIHEILHTLRLGHPFEITQTEDTRLLRVAPNSVISLPTTDPDIINNIMNYPQTIIDGKTSKNQNMLTKGQLQFMMKEIELQNKGFGFKPRYNNALSNEENMKAYKKLYTDYWNNIPGEPVKNR